MVQRSCMAYYLALDRFCRSLSEKVEGSAFGNPDL